MNHARPLPDYLVRRYHGWKATTYEQNKGWYMQLAEGGQHPRAMVVSCCDSRVHVTSIFGADQGEFFIPRNTENLIPPQETGGNHHGTSAAVEYAVTAREQGRPVTGILFYSTSEIYGDPDPDNIPTPETYRGNVSCTGPRACYDESKRYGETLCVNFAQQHQIPVQIARPFNNYGPGLKLTDARVLPDFVRNVLAGEDIVMYSDGTPTRTFCYIADAIVGYYRILFRGAAGESYNIGIETPEVSMRTLAESVVAQATDLFDYTGQVVMKTNADADYLVDNPNRRCPVIEKARRDLGYNPKVNVDQGLRRTMLWYNENRETEEA